MEARMNAVKRIALVASMVLIAAWAGLSLGAQENARAGGLRVGVVNLGQAFENHYRKKEFAAALMADSAKKLGILEAKSKEIGKLEEELELFDLGTDAGKRTEQALFHKRVELETYRRLAQEESLRQQRAYTTRLFDDIQARVSEYAKRQKLDLVLKTEDSEITARTLELAQLEIKLQAVLYFSPALDITDQVIAALNAGHVK